MKGCIVRRFKQESNQFKNMSIKILNRRIVEEYWIEEEQIEDG